MKKLKSVLSPLLSAAIILSMASAFAPSARAYTDPELDTEIAFLIEDETGAVLYEKNADQKTSPASTTKIMTVLLAVEACEGGNADLDDTVVIENDIYFDVTANASTLNLKDGERISLRDLLYCVMLSSSNEACNAIAKHISGDVSSFVELMNQKALELGCTNTNFINTHGLNKENHYSTARDLAIIMSAALKHPILAEIMSTRSYTVSANNISDPRAIANTNKQIFETSQYYYENAIGGKTGYTDAGGFCLVSAAKNNGITLISVVLKGKLLTTSNNTTQTTNFTDTNKLFKWGFSSFSYRTILSTIDLITELPVSMGDGSDSVVLCPAKDITVLMDNDIDFSEFTRKTIIYDKELTAPVSQGEVLGRVTVYLDDVPLGTVDLVANSSIELLKIEQVKDEIKNALSNVWVKIGITVVVLILAAYITFIVLYNRRRHIMREREAALKRQRIKELHQREMNTIGKSFEEIEIIHSQRH